MTHCEVRIVHKSDPPPFPELAEKTVHVVALDAVTVLEGGTANGRASVALFATLPDGSVVMIETTARIFDMIAGAVRGGCLSWGETP